MCDSCSSYIFNVLIWKLTDILFRNKRCCSAEEDICSCSCTIWAGEHQGCPRVLCPALQKLARIPQVLESLHCHPHGLCWINIEAVLGGSALCSEGSAATGNGLIEDGAKLIPASSLKDFEAKRTTTVMKCVRKYFPSGSSEWTDHSLAQLCLYFTHAASFCVRY